MHSFQAQAFLIWLISLVSILLMLLRPSHVTEAVWISAGATLLVVARLVPLHDVALRREKVEITAWQFFKVGAVAMPLALVASILVLWALN